MPRSKTQAALLSSLAKYKARRQENLRLLAAEKEELKMVEEKLSKYEDRMVDEEKLSKYEDRIVSDGRPARESEAEGFSDTAEDEDSSSSDKPEDSSSSDNPEDSSSSDNPEDSSSSSVADPGEEDEQNSASDSDASTASSTEITHDITYHSLSALRLVDHKLRTAKAAARAGNWKKVKELVNDMRAVVEDGGFRRMLELAAEKEKDLKAMRGGVKKGGVKKGGVKKGGVKKGGVKMGGVAK